MIIIEDVHKRYRTDHGPGKWVLQGINMTIPANSNVGLIGGNGAGKSTLLRIIGGVDQPTKGRVERRCSVSWPMGQGSGLQPSLTGRQNARFVCRIHGHESEIPRLIDFIQDFAEIGDAFDEPIKTYSSGMRSRLQFALSLAIDFDVYISDEVTGAGDILFRKKAAAAFKNLANRASMIMVSHGEGILRQFCTKGIWLHNGNAQWYDDINDALMDYKKDQLQVELSHLELQLAKGGTAQIETDIAKNRQILATLALLEKSLKGDVQEVSFEEGAQILPIARQNGINLTEESSIPGLGYQLKPDQKPMLKRFHQKPRNHLFASFYDLYTQCTKVEFAE